MAELDDLTLDFLRESRENLERLDAEIVALEENPSDEELLSGIFRTFHTLKGSCGFLGFRTLEGVAHAAENLLSRLREGEMVLSPAMTTVILESVDAIRAILDNVEETGGEGAAEYGELVEKLQALTAGEEVREQETESATGVRRGLEHSDTIRLDLAVSNRLMNLVGELVLARNQLLQLTETREDPRLHGAVQRVSHVTSDLQGAILKTRMQPIDRLWVRLPRIVRDTARSCDKTVDLDLQGEETELDKTLLEALGDPLVHLVRNAIDHGIEPPEERKSAGKSEAGKLSFQAFHDGGQVVLEVSDDGRGIDADRVREKAMEMELLTVEGADRLSDRQALQLIFRRGFSTAETLTSVSGRGVGMDVVKANIEKIGGTIDVESEVGVGTTFRIKIPLTLAIIPALVVRTGGQRFAIPQLHLEELVRLVDPDAIETVYDTPVLRLRGDLLPLVDLNGLLRLEETREADRPEHVNVVVLRVGEREFGLLVDEVEDTQEIVVKPLNRLLDAIPVFGGATILGDGSVALILDVRGMAQWTRVVADLSEEDLLQQMEKAKQGEEEEADERLLILRGPDDSRLIIPLDRVARLEEFEPARVERVGGREMVQYRGSILPLVRVYDILPERRTEFRHPASQPETDALQVVVHEQEERSVGLIVQEILDIIDGRLEDMRPPSRFGVVGTVVIQERVAEVLDVEGVVRKAEPFVDGGEEPGE